LFSLPTETKMTDTGRQSSLTSFFFGKQKERDEALKNESWSEENYSWSAKPAITSNGEHYARTRAPENQQYFSMLE
jgi:hypothetical protein